MPTDQMNRLLDQAKVGLPGSLDGALLLQLFAVTGELLDFSNAWQEDIEFMVTPTQDTYLQNPDAFTYTMTPAAGAVNRLLSVVDAQGFAVQASMAVPGDVVLASSPSEEQQYVARVALTVIDPLTVDNTPDFPDWIVHKYREVLLDGLLGRMMTQPAKPYTSFDLGRYHLRRFQSGKSKAKVEVQHKNVYRAQAWRFPQTFNRGPR